MGRRLAMVAIVGAACVLSPARGSEVGFSFDRLNRLTRVQYSNGVVIDYGYDAAGNRTSRRVYAVQLGDLDGDLDVDLRDFARFQVCFGSDGVDCPVGGSVSADLDGDGAVNLEDLGFWFGGFSGPISE